VIERVLDGNRVPAGESAGMNELINSALLAFPLLGVNGLGRDALDADIEEVLVRRFDVDRVEARQRASHVTYLYLLNFE
jgi:hypothetical protein